MSFANQSNGFSSGGGGGGGGGTLDAAFGTAPLIVGTDTILVTLANTPIDSENVIVFINNAQYPTSAGYWSLAGSTITWLAGTGAAFNLDVTDEYQVFYWF